MKNIFLKPENASSVVLFATGSGGNPERHEGLLKSLSKNGCVVVAPYFERIAQPMPQEEELMQRVSLIREALKNAGELNLPLVGIGHSIGATLLMAMAGAQMWLGPGKRLSIDKYVFKKLVLFAPPTGFFRAPNALDELRVPMQLWGGALDTITPPAQLEFLTKALNPDIAVEMRVEKEAGHFSFMNSLPPHVTDTLQNRDAFLAEMTGEVCRFVVN